MSLELCLFRHGRTTWNAARRWQGQADVDLDALGRAQAAAVGRRVAGMAANTLFSSDLRRCLDVAEAVADTTSLPIETDKRLHERDVGDWSGLTREEIQQRFPEQWRAWTAFENVRMDGGESSDEMWQRVVAFLDDVRDGTEDGCVVAVTHGGWIFNAVTYALLGERRRTGIGVPTQASLTVLVSEGGGPFKLEAFNDRGHLLDVEPIDHEDPAPHIY